MSVRQCGEEDIRISNEQSLTSGLRQYATTLARTSITFGIVGYGMTSISTNATRVRDNYLKCAAISTRRETRGIISTFCAGSRKNPSVIPSSDASEPDQESP